MKKKARPPPARYFNLSPSPENRGAFIKDSFVHLNIMKIIIENELKTV
jgi:hypothetical protein